MVKPSWRKIETALISILREYGFPLTEERGNTFIDVQDVDVCVADFAKELEERL